MHSSALITRLISGDTAVTALIAQQATTSSDPQLLAAAAVLAPDHPELLERARQSALSTTDRQLVAIAGARLAGDHQLVDALVQDHLADHPGSIIAAWLATSSIDRPHPRRP